ncbi:TPA: hypothetical protein ACOAUQ_002549 [Enterococcus faecium]
MKKVLLLTSLCTVLSVGVGNVVNASDNDISYVRYTGSLAKYIAKEDYLKNKLKTINAPAYYKNKLNTALFKAKKDLRSGTTDINRLKITYNELLDSIVEGTNLYNTFSNDLLLAKKDLVETMKIASDFLDNQISTSNNKTDIQQQLIYADNILQNEYSSSYDYKTANDLLKMKLQEISK